MKFIVVGDLILDRFIYGDINRISPEAPVPVLDVKNSINSPGGAYNVHAHIHNLGCDSTFISVVGDDFNKMSDDFFPTGINKNVFLINEKNRTTSLKTRLIAIYNHNHQIRFDAEATDDIKAQSENMIIERVKSIITKDSFLILNDYKKGVITTNLSEKLIKIANSIGAKSFVDSKRDDVSRFKNSFMLKPNKYEFQQIKLRFNLSDDFEKSCYELLDLLNIQNLVVTMGDNGIYSFTKGSKPYFCPSKKITVKELSGAGDSVLAAISVAISKGHDISKSIKIANNIAAKFISTGIEYRANLNDFK